MSGIRLVVYDFEGVMIDFEPALRPELVPEVCGVFAKNLHASYEFGARKPDAAVFTRLLEHCRVPAQQAVFVDDDYQFIQGAISAGMHGIHFQSRAALRVALEPMLDSPA